MKKNNLKTVLIALFSGIMLTSTAQPLAKGLLWEITGNGLTKPSYLYGTMHVSSKVAFNLSDSFFIALKSADKVALESTPENWLEEFLTTDFLNYAMRTQGKEDFGEENFITSDGLAWFKEFYGKQHIKQALAADPALINQLMFRHTSNKQDFEEDTYLDLYIFQTASRLGKQVVSVEGLEESLKLVMKAYTEMFDEDKERKFNPDFNELLEEYYRQMDLNKMDSLIIKQGYSAEYFENMLYKRNRNMVKQMDSIMRKNSLFTGVGASHLPGDKGVIKLLAEMGYQVRAVNLGYRNSKIRAKIDALKVPVVYKKYQSADGIFSVDVPGKLLTMPGNGLNQQYLYTDMMNGTFYKIDRIRTMAPFVNISAADLPLIVDSLLYENIPGDIISKKETTLNGYKTIDITNKSKRGNFQQYRIVITPFEVYVLKAGGKGDYIKKNGAQFFASFMLNQPANLTSEFQSQTHGFTIAFPTKPLLNYEASSLKGHAPGTHFYYASDQKDVNYVILHQTFVNTTYLEEDTVELNLIAKGVVSGLNMKEIDRSYKNNNGYLMLQCNYKNASDVPSLTANYAIKGSHVYAVLAWYKDESGKQQATNVLNSFKLTAVVSGPAEMRTDSSHFFSVNSSVSLPPDIEAYLKSAKKIEAGKYDDDFSSINCYDANTGERVLVDYQRVNKYYNVKDTTDFWKLQWNKANSPGYFIQKTTINNSGPIPSGTIHLTDTNCSRMIIVKVLAKGRSIYTLTVHTDTITQGNNFQREFLKSFTVFDTTNFDLFADRTPQLLADLVSKDSTTYAQARNSERKTLFKGKNYKKIIETIEKLEDDKYKKEIHENLIGEIGLTEEKSVIPYLKSQYSKFGEDYDMQLAILIALTKIKSTEAYTITRDLLLKQPPFATNAYRYREFSGSISSDDSTWIRKLFLPDLLKLVQYDEYKDMAYEMLAEAIDSNKIAFAQYEPYLNTIIIDAKKALTKELTKDVENNYSNNFELITFNHILIKHYNLPQVKEYFDKQLKIKNSQVKINALAYLLGKNKAVHDTIIFNLAQNKQTRLDLYYALNQNAVLSKMPAEFNNQQKLVDAYVYDMVKPGYGEHKLDTFIFLMREQTYFKGKVGFVYFYKYKLSNSDDWNTYSCGIQPLDTNTFSFVKRLNGKSKDAFDESKDVTEQFFTALDERKDAGRNDRYSSDYVSDYPPDYFPEMEY